MRSSLIATIGVFCGLLGCGPAPYAVGPDDAPATVEIAAPLPGARRGDAADDWVPGRFPRPNPFAETRLWRGAYDCPQGRTELVLQVTDVHDNWIRAVFQFHHAPSGAAGRYFVAGDFDPRSGALALVPGPWIHRPDGYVSVGMEGRVSPQGESISGRITHPDCGGFRVRPVDR